MAAGALLALVPALLLAQGAWAQNQYCDNKFYWLPGGKITPGGRDWSSWGKIAGTGFGKGPCTMVSGIGVTETYMKTVIIIDRSDVTNTYAKLNGRGWAYAQEINFSGRRWTQRGLDIITNTFCSSGQHGRDGTFFSIAGDWSPGGYIKEGEFSIRSFKPCKDGRCDFELVTKMAHSRWYPTTQLLGDGRMMIVGGSTRGTDLNRQEINAANVEYFPRKAGERFYPLKFLEQTLPYNLYPFLHLLPSGLVFMFAGNQYILYDTNRNAPAARNTPALRVKGNGGSWVFFNYPLTATSVMFPIKSGRNFQAEIMICGGQSQSAKSTHSVDGNGWAAAENACYRITPEAKNPRWVTERMTLRRVMPNAVLLPDGHALIINGAQTGYANIPNFAHNAALTPDMYNTETHRWYKGSLATSKIPRVYHGSALLLHDGSVFISGSNPNSQIKQGANDHPTEFRTEFFYPPYMRKGLTRPRITKGPGTVPIGGSFYVDFLGAPSFRRISVVLAQPGFSTHSANHGMRNVVLDVLRVSNRGGKYVARVAGPTSANHCPPTWYWLFVLIDGVPNGEGTYVFVK